MTALVGIYCRDGIVIGADSASSDVDAGTKQITETKIKRIGTTSVIYGGSGDVGLLQKIGEELALFKPPNSLKRIRQEIKRISRS